ncbi:hypothetical protein [Halorubrum distributum]|jgi:hypothetical protein|uniref:Uncharacterized protein n=1 Tax=Halorubrum distributum TaxID=29283 RepID=A0A6B1IMB6_9EURY|nr:hypothetical protein [Halorubrum terrestre]MYL67759.1 hypothetical protein [Halorubrum terrestre]
MPSQAPPTRATVDLSELGFDADADVEISVDERDDETVVEVAHETGEWTLTFDEFGELKRTPGRSAPRWLGPAIKKAAPGLRVL